VNLTETRTQVMCDGLRLQAALHEGDGALSALVLHPHPQYGGDMDNHVVMALCGALAQEGATTMRLNFRGTGASEGEYDGGRGEAGDAMAAAVYLREHQPNARLVLAGYSFGAAIAASVAERVAPAGLVLVSPPGQTAPSAPAGVPTLILCGDIDHVAPAQALQALESDTVRVTIAEGVDHSWWNGTAALSEAVRSFARNLRPEQ
jgi:alpha/beta superfamily hydrolase